MVNASIKGQKKGRLMQSAKQSSKMWWWWCVQGRKKKAVYSLVASLSIARQICQQAPIAYIQSVTYMLHHKRHPTAMT